MYLWELFDYFDWGNDFSHFFENLDKINLCNILIYSLFLQRSIFTSKTKTFSIYSLSYQVSGHPKLNLSSSFSFPTFFNWNPSTLANLIKTMRVSHIMLVTDLNGCDYSFTFIATTYTALHVMSDNKITYFNGIIKSTTKP